MALQVLPVRGRVRFLRLAHPPQTLGLHCTNPDLPPCVAHNGSQMSVSMSGPQATDVQVDCTVLSRQGHTAMFGPLGGRQRSLTQLPLQHRGSKVLQGLPSGMHSGRRVVVVEVVVGGGVVEVVVVGVVVEVLVEVEVVLVEVVEVEVVGVVVVVEVVLLVVEVVVPQ